MTVDEKGLADEIKREMMSWRGASGGVHTIRACAFAIAQKMAPRLEPARSAEPLAWTYELASTVNQQTRERGGWKPWLSRHKPYVPKDAIRNLTPLYAHPTPEASDASHS